MTPGFWLGRPGGSRYRPSGLGTEAEGQVSGESDAVGHSGEEKFLFFLLSSSRPTADSASACTPWDMDFPSQQNISFSEMRCVNS